jgi:GWxTD domain-containing protein
MRVKLLVVITVVMIAGIAEAGLSKAAQEWRRGPEKFLLTNEEEKAWKSVSSDEQAAAFIDLFWARRDPTDGTPRNEFREEFLSRVRYSDSAFEEKRMRGAITQRGQVYILLGPPESGARANMSVMGNSSGLSSASARSVDNLIWVWPREVAVALGVPRITATFNQVVGGDMYTRDTKVGQFSNISEKVILKNVVHPEMTVVPDWATRFSKEVFAAGAVSASAPAPKGGAKASGRMGRLVLLGDLGSLNLDADTDPLASLAPMTEYARDADMAFVLEYCGVQAPLKLEWKINSLSAASEIEPAAMKAVAGCGALPGMLSLSGLGAGSHEMQITIIEPNGSRVTTKQRFQIK